MHLHPEQLPSLLDYIFNELHSDSVMLENVKENRTWSQPWYFPRTPDAERLDLFQSYQYSGSILNADVIHSKWEKSQPPRIEPKQNPVKVKIDESNGRINSMQVFNQSFSVHDILIRNSYIKKVRSIYDQTQKAKYRQFSYVHNVMTARSAFTLMVVTFLMMVMPMMLGIVTDS